MKARRRLNRAREAATFIEAAARALHCRQELAASRAAAIVAAAARRHARQQVPHPPYRHAARLQTRCPSQPP